MLAAGTTARGDAPIDEWIIHCPECSSPVTVRPGDKAVACESCHSAFDPESLTTRAFVRKAAEAPQDPNDELVGRTLGVWRLTRLIGRGGMGRVYEAKGPKGRKVALKVLAEDLAADPTFVKRFRREARVLASLSHPHVVEILDRGEADGRVFFVMEYIRGENLRRRLERGPLSLVDTVRIAREVASALAYAHARGVVHRDLKPENVLLDAKDRVHLVDFGLSRLAGDGGVGATTALTRTDVILGTYEYMAPEQRRGDKDVDPRADVFALGVILYEMLTGQLPLGRFAPPSQVRSGIPPSFDAVINRALATHRSGRYPNAEALSRAIEEAHKAPRRKTATPPPPSRRGAGTAMKAARPPDTALLSEAEVKGLKGMLRHVDVLAALDRVLGILLILGCFGIVSSGAFLRFFGDFWIFPVSSGIVLFIAGVLFLQLGGKMSRMQPGARDGQITASVLLLIFPPFLTVFGLYGLIVLTGDKARRAFALGRKQLEGPRPVVAQKVVKVPQTPRKEVPWALLRVFFVAALLWTLYAGIVAAETGGQTSDETLVAAFETMPPQRLLALKISVAGLVVAFVFVILAFVERKTRRGLGLAVTAFLLFAACTTVLANLHSIHRLAPATARIEAPWIQSVSDPGPAVLEPGQPRLENRR